jgi:hypothetical protein
MPVFPVEIYIESTKIKVKLEAFNTVPCEMSPFIVNLLTRASMEAKSPLLASNVSINRFRAVSDGLRFM